MILIFILGYPHTPQGRPQGEGVGDLEGGWVLFYHKKSYFISNLGFSIVGNSKMIAIYILGYPQPPQERLRGEGEGGEGVWRGV